MAAAALFVSPVAVTLVFYMLGNAILLPWNFFITAETYWQYKLRNTTLDDVSGDEGDATAPLTPLQRSFTPTLVIVSNVFSTLFFFVTSAVVKRVSEGVRIYGSLGASLVAMLIITLLTFINTDEWQQGFYVITMVVVAVLSMCMAVTQGSGSGLAGLFPPSCMATLMSGQALAGVISSLARIFSLLAGEEPITSGLVFFAISDVFLVATLVSYWYLRRMNYYKGIKNNIASIKEGERKKNDDDDDRDGREGGGGGKKNKEESDWRTYFRVFVKIWPMGVTVALALLITLAVFPAVVVYITSTLPESRWTEVFFQPTVTFLLFNVGDVLGRELTRWLRWPGPKGWPLHVAGACRVVFIPLLMLCHGDNKTFPTVFDHDVYYIIFNLLFSMTNGYIITLTFIYYQTLVEEDELEMGGAIMVALVGVGLVAGSLISPGLVAWWGPQ
ncbi:equilibrative nucleoside transporter 1-like isoform X3 [Eriocheir sinensis]|uniref:equilibrative nucleoside transporter 1-like isoform X3 n=1 Tax=Eriocheir sinensis TaxID=95602 RepID=UPI0021C99DBB|nr:equilibrative nucleoside transporter 1-like isoform X3 [Eriocheir sinensis]